MISRKQLGPPSHEYATVWVLRIIFTTLTIRIHHWYGSDDQEAYHDHPQWFWLLVLWGGYDDYSPIPRHLPQPCGLPQRVDRLRWLSWRLRPASYQHFVKPRTKNVWTLLVFGGEKRRWGFYETRGGKRYPRDKWFAERGHHVQNGGPRVRLRPDGSVIQ